MRSLKRIAAALLAMGMGISVAQAQNAPVTIKEDAKTWTMDNGIVTAIVAKESGDLVSMKYKNLEMLATVLTEAGTPDLDRDPPGESKAGLNRGMTDHQYGFWSHDAMGVRGTQAAVPSITIDPRTNGGERAEVGVKGISNGRAMGTGPGAQATGNFIADIEIRWALGRGDSGVYTYCQFNHKPEYAATSITEARFCAKLAAMFDWMSVADTEHHNKYYPSTLREGDKYIYTTNQTKNPAFGWSSQEQKVGFFIINPSMEYMSGGPTKIEFLGHRDTNAVAAPCVLNYWRSSHYGASQVAVDAGEQWTKVIGPFMLYVNSGADPQAIYRDARSQATKEQQKWPFNWVNGVDYPTSKDRVTVKGQFVLTDAQKPGAKLPNLMVGLTPAAYPGGFGPRPVGWQQDAKYYQFWVTGKDDGQFDMPNIRPGKYELHAFADGVLGEFVKADVVVEAGKPLDMGKVTWTPVRQGKQIWEIGVPNRLGVEFLGGPEHWQTNSRIRYAELFPNDITYTIGKSDWTKDWYYAHVPRASMDAPAPAPPPGFGGGRGRGPATGPAGVAGGFPGAGRGPQVGGAGPTTIPGNIAGIPTTGPARAGRGRGPAGPTNGFASPRTVVFDMPAAARGKATLRLGLSATNSRTIDISVNGQPAGQLSNLPTDGALSSHGQHGIWQEAQFSFDGSLLKQGSNTLTLTMPAGAINNGVIYDYLRLELDDSARATAN